MADVVKPIQAIPIEMTDELRAKFRTVAYAFIDICKREGLNPVESYGALSFTQSALEHVMGGKVHGTVIFGERERDN